MPSTVLARKWRPKQFTEMVGQGHVLKALKHALEQQRLHHAYLFSGCRGSGKTTTARVLAKCFNCETGITATPCGECITCIAVDEGRFVDLIEVDAASRTKVDDTKELLDNVPYAPTQGRFKIYLIDEVHMLSNHSFNALLKTLEEPPAHVKFLLATTEPQKLPVTVLSRCLHFTMKPLSIKQITQHLAHLLEQENIAYEEGALEPLAQSAQGSMRDALSLLEQAVSYCEGRLIETGVREMLGLIDPTLIWSLFDAVARREAKALLLAVEHLSDQGADYSQVLGELTVVLTQVSIAQSVDSVVNDSNVLKFASQFTKEEVQLLYQIALLGRRDLPLAYSQRAGFEMIMLRMLAFTPLGNDSRSQKPQHQAEPKNQTEVKSISTSVPTSMSKPVLAPASAPVSESVLKSAPNPAPKDSARVEASESGSDRIADEINRQVKQRSEPSFKTEDPRTEDPWSQLIDQLSLKGMSLALARHCACLKQTDNTVELSLDSKQAPLLIDSAREQLQQALNHHFNQAVKLSIEVGGSSVESPSALKQAYDATKKAEAESSLKEDPFVQSMMSQFDATFETDTIDSRATSE